MKKERDYFFVRSRKLLKPGLTMKIFAFFSLICVLNTQAINIQAQQNEIQINVKDKPLTEVLKMIQQQSGYNILYSNELVKNTKTVDITVNSKDISVIMKACLESTSLDFEIENGTIIIKTQQAIPQALSTRKVKGTVIDTKSGMPLPGVTVTAQQEGQPLTGAATDENGYFEINLPSGIEELTFTSIGYKTVIAKIETDKEMTIRMTEEINAIDEVVVTGYFTKAKSSYTGAAKTISGDELKMISGTNIITALAAITPGLDMIERSELGSNPNHVPELLLRGMSSFSSGTNQINQPTIILDGVEISMTDLYDLDMNEIESITVLKDASATALYGARAANGVIVVERKKLTEGSMRVTYNLTGNVQFPYLKDYHLLNAAQKLEYERLAGLYHAEIKDDGFGHISGYKEQYELDRLYNERYQEVLRGVNSDWLAQPARTAFSHDHSLRLYGGASKVRYELSGRFNNTQGVMKEDYRRRYNLGFKLEYHIQDKFTLANRSTYNEVATKETPYGDFSQYTNLNPYDRIYDKFGNPNTELSWNIDNPLYEATLGNYNTASSKTFSNTTDIRWEISKLFRITGNFNISVNEDRGEIYYSPDSKKFKTEEDVSKKGSLTKTSGNGVSYAGNLTGSFNKTTENNSLISLAAGMEIRKDKNENSSLMGIGIFDDALNFIGQTAGYPDGDKPFGNQAISTDLGFFANANYMYNNRYYADFVYRITGSSKFGANNRYGNFWSGGIGWNLHNEKFFQSSQIDLLKIRGSIGYTGKVNFEPFQAMTIYNYSGDLEYKNGIGAVPLSIGNEDLKWERELSYNVGTDVSLFSRRLNLTLDLYLKRTTDLVLDQSKAPSIGLVSGKENIGEMENKGIEIQVDGYVIQQNNCYWQIGATGYTNRNRILKISNALKHQNDLNNKQNSVAPLGQYEEGESTSALKVVRSGGIDPATGQEVYIKRNGERTFEYSPDDKIVIGDKESKFKGTLYTNFYYKGFSIYLLGNFKFGGYLYNTTRATKVEGAHPMYNADSRVFSSRWKQAGDLALYKDIKDTSVPKQTDRFVEKENVFTLGTVNLGYEFSPQICNKLHLRKLRVGLNMTDILRLSNVKIERGTDYLYSNGFEFTLSTTF